MAAPGEDHTTTLMMAQYQNAHLMLSVACRERKLAAAEASLQEQRLLAELLEQRCMQLEQAVRCLRAGVAHGLA